MQPRFAFGALIVGSLLLVGAGCASEQPAPNGDAPAATVKTDKSYTYEALNFTFQSPVELQIKDVGAEPGTAVSAGIPGDNGKLKFNAVFTVIDDATRQALNKEQALQNAKTTYLGVSKPATERFARTFFGRRTPGDKQTTTIPTASTVESYLVETPSDQWLFVGIKYQNAMSSEEAEKIIASIAETLKENPKN